MLRTVLVLLRTPLLLFCLFLFFTGRTWLGSFILAGLIFYLFYLLNELRIDAIEKAAVRARRNELKEDCENLCATYDSRKQASKSLMPRSSSITASPKMKDVVVEQKPVPPPNMDKSQVSPNRMPPDYYKILGISHSANLEEIKQAAKMKGTKIKTAFAVLSQVETRATYDAKPNLGPLNHYAILLVKKLADHFS